MIEKEGSASTVPSKPRSGVLTHNIAMAIAATMAVLSPLKVEATGASNTTIVNIHQANTAATNLANTYTYCCNNNKVLSVSALRAARADFMSVTIFGSTHGVGENPVDAQGNTVDWSVIAKWLGLGEWLNKHIAKQTRLIAERQSEGNQVKIQQGPNPYNASVPRCMVDDTQHIPREQNTPRYPVKRGKATTYMIMPGDTLINIAEKFGVSVEALLYANPGIGNPDEIKAFWNLTIPARNTRNY